MSREQFMWGLSNGVIVLTISSAFWLGLAAWTVSPIVLLIAAAPILLLHGPLVRRGFRLRLLAPGFSRASLRSAPKGSSIHRIGIAFNIVGTVETVGIVLVGLVCWKLNRPDLIWPLIGLVISLHFVPLGWVFNVRPYYGLAVAGTAAVVFSLLVFSGSARTFAVGIGLGYVTGFGAVYLLVNAVAVADWGLRHRSPEVELPNSAVASLLFLQAPLFGWYAIAALTPARYGSGGFPSFQAGQTSVIASAEFLAAAVALGLAVFVWRRSRIALVVSTIVCLVEIVLTALWWVPVVFKGFWLYFAYFLIVPLPLAAPGVLALPTLVLCLFVLRSRARDGPAA